ncbi:hypothetical protein PC115_g6429 [Phytophthora cactorum]|uniref:Uncharacterized protein n=1 Tax=Phytophthora cactorum TaxID=29920 RepID=A0A8T1CT40_9STRA|nr:hypothetical protein PC115_g6429 [Phytophthora cactorum]
MASPPHVSLAVEPLAGTTHFVSVNIGSVGSCSICSSGGGSRASALATPASSTPIVIGTSIHLRRRFQRPHRLDLGNEAAATTAARSSPPPGARDQVPGLTSASSAAPRITSTADAASCATAATALAAATEVEVLPPAAVLTVAKAAKAARFSKTAKPPKAAKTGNNPKPPKTSKVYEVCSTSTVPQSAGVAMFTPMASASTQPASYAATTSDAMTASASVPTQDPVAAPRVPSLAEPALLSDTAEHLSTGTSPRSDPSSSPRPDVGYLDDRARDRRHEASPSPPPQTLRRAACTAVPASTSSSTTAPFDTTDFLSRFHAGGQAPPAHQHPTHAPEAAPRASTSILNDARHADPSQVSVHPITCQNFGIWIPFVVLSAISLAFHHPPPPPQVSSFYWLVTF